MKTCCIIPIKATSERVKGKNFRLVCGTPLYQAIIAKCVDSNVFTDVFVDTDSKEVEEFAKTKDVQVISRKPELALPSANGNDLLNYHAEIKPEYDFYFQIFATAPLLKQETIQKAVNFLLNSGTHDSILTAVQHFGFFWRQGMPLSYRPSLLPRSQDLIPIDEESTGLYGISKNSLLKYRSRIGAKPAFLGVSKLEAIDLNTEEDFHYLEWLVSSGRATMFT